MMFLTLVLAATLSAGNAEFDDSARRGACDISLSRLKAETVEKGLVSGVLEKAMLAEPAKFVATNEAKRLCRMLYSEALARQYRAAADGIAHQLGLAEPMTNAAAETVAAAAKERFDAAYAAERAAAVVAQAKTIAGAVRPSEVDFEKKDESVLRREMTVKVAAEQKTPVFEENLRYISEKIVDPVIADGRREMKRQHEYLSRTKCESYAPEALAREIEENLRKNVADRQAKEKNPTKAWVVFPGVVRDGIPRAVERRMAGIVTKCVDDVALAVDRETVLKAIAADPAAHRKTSESEKIFRNAYAAQILGGALDKAVAEAPEKERAAFADYVRAHTTSPDLTRAVEVRLKREVLPKWRQARDEVAKAEASRLWPTLADRTWFPEAELADRMAARSDYAAAVKAWRETPELESFAKADGGKPLMEETVANADKSVSEAFDLARNAITAQNTILGEVEPDVLGVARDRKSSFWRKTPDFKAIVGLLTEAVEEKWGERRERILWGDGERPSNADKQHAELFPSVKKRIELVARSILEEMEKPEPEPEKKPEPEDPKPEDPTDSDQQSEEPQLMKFSIIVEKDGDQVSVKLEQGKTTVAERSAKAKMSDYQGAMKFVSDKLGTDILKLK